MERLLDFRLIHSLWYIIGPFCLSVGCKRFEISRFSKYLMVISFSITGSNLLRPTVKVFFSFEQFFRHTYQLHHTFDEVIHQPQ
jgi:hypothetical protein